jgi:sugar O-acyltransferase (sialic acid O-acetyltransferase NeuD family)
MEIYLIGAQNHETVRYAKACRVTGYLDSTPEKKGTDFHGFKVFGWMEVFDEINGPDVWYISMVTGSTEARRKSYLTIKEAGGRFANIVHPSVNLDMVIIDEGAWIQEAVILQASVKLGKNVSVHTGAVVAHETTVGNHSFIANGVQICGCCEIGEGVFIGANAVIQPRIKIGNWSTIGSGAVVTMDVPDHATVVGNPARRI